MYRWLRIALHSVSIAFILSAFNVWADDESGDGDHPPPEEVIVEGIKPEARIYDAFDALLLDMFNEGLNDIPNLAFLEDDIPRPEENCETTEHPVVLSTGNKVLVQNDFATSGLVPFGLTRNYSLSRAGRKGIFGSSWFSEYDISLMFEFSGGGVCRAVPGQTTNCMSSSVSSAHIEKISKVMPDGAQYTYTKSTTSANEWIDQFGSIKRNSDGSFTSSDASGTVETFNQSGFITSSQSRVRPKLTFEYNGNYLRRVTQAGGAKIEFIWLNGKLTHIDDPAGSRYSYNYNTQGYLSGVTYPNGTGNTTYHYEQAGLPGAVTGISIDGVRYSKYSYYANGKVIESGIGSTGESEKSTFSYGVENGLEYTLVTNAAGAIEKYWYSVSDGNRNLVKIDRSGVSNCPNSTVAYTYTSEGHKDKATDSKGNVTDYDYTPAGLIKKTTRGLRWGDSARTFTVTTADTQVSEVDWLPGNDALIDEVRAPGVTTKYDYWPTGRIKSITKTDTTNKSNLFGATNGQQRIWSFSYTYHNVSGVPADSLVKTLTIDGPLDGTTDTTILEYDPRGNLLTVTNAAGHVTQYSDHNGLGQPRKISDPNSVETVIDYNVRGWTESVTVKDPGGDIAADATIDYEWNNDGTLKKLTSPDGGSLTYQYNSAKHLVEIENNLGETLTYQPNALGLPVAETTRDASYHKVRHRNQFYDELGRLKSRFRTSGRLTYWRTDYRYDTNGNLKIIVESGDESTITTTFRYDGLDRLSSISKPASTAVNGVDTRIIHKTSFKYDAANNLISVTDPKDFITTYIYNGFGEKITQISPDTGTTHYWYDKAGRLSHSRDARGITVTYHYDVLGRIELIEYPNSSNNISYFYDETSSTNPFAYGRLSRIVDGSGGATYVYDHRGNVTEDIRTVDDQTYSVEYEHNLANNIGRIRYPSGRVVRYGRDDPMGRPASILTRRYESAIDQTVIGEIAYLPFGPVAEHSYGNGVELEVQRDLDYRVDKVLISGNQVLVNLDYDYDKFGNVSHISNLLNESLSQSFLYDELHRLQEAFGPYASDVNQLHYEYDVVGNRRLAEHRNGATLKKSEVYTYHPDSHRLDYITTHVGAATSNRSFSYTAAGNVEKDTSALRVLDSIYNSPNRLASVKENGIVKANYWHNALGQRVRKELPTIADRHSIYDKEGNLIAEYDGSGNLIREYIYLNGVNVSQITPPGQSSSLNLGPVSSPSNNSPTSMEWLLESEGEMILNLQSSGDENGPSSYSLYVSQQQEMGGSYAKLSVSQKRQFVPIGLSGNTVVVPIWLNQQMVYETLDASTNHLDQLPLSSSNQWLKFRRTSTGVIISTSSNGTTWAQLANQPLALAGPVYLGFVAKNIKMQMTVSGITRDVESSLYVIPDHLGSPYVVTNEAAQVVWSATKKTPFGEFLDSGSVSQPLRFPGQYLDVETGTHYNYFRDYDPTLGRYLQSDPIGLAGGLNTYAYAGSNSLSFIDPYGLWSFSFDAYRGIGGGITFGKHNDTGEWFVGGRLGVGLGIGGNLNILDNGPTDRDLLNHPYADETSCRPQDSGNSVGTNINIGTNLGPYEVSYGAKGGAYLDGSNGHYSEGPGPGMQFNPLNYGAGIGASATIEVFGW